MAIRSRIRDGKISQQLPALPQIKLCYVPYQLAWRRRRRALGLVSGSDPFGTGLVLPEAITHCPSDIYEPTCLRTNPVRFLLLHEQMLARLAPFDLQKFIEFENSSFAAQISLGYRLDLYNAPPLDTRIPCCLHGRLATGTCSMGMRGTTNRHLPLADDIDSHFLPHHDD